jgi:hypothetical protein
MFECAPRRERSFWSSGHVKKNLSSRFFDLDIENPLGRGTLAKIEPPCSSKMAPTPLILFGLITPTVTAV